MQIRFCLFVCLWAAWSSIATAQTVQLPQPSPRASVLQVVGLTEIKIDYSSPAVNGRKIWGDIVPYNEMWRAGANRPTKITFSEEVEINGQKVAKGAYTLIAIPTEQEWTWILSKDSKGNGVFSYDAADDVLRFTAKAEKSGAFAERLAYTISANDNVTGVVTLTWENVSASFAVKTDPATAGKQNINASLGNVWYSYALAAEFYLKNNLDLAEATKFIDNSIMLREHFFNRWLKALILEAQGNAKEALKFAQEAQTIGEKVNDNFYKSYKDAIAEGIAKWK